MQFVAHQVGCNWYHAGSPLSTDTLQLPTQFGPCCSTLGEALGMLLCTYKCTDLGSRSTTYLLLSTNVGFS